jgi:hypothetical protein
VSELSSYSLATNYKRKRKKEVEDAKSVSGMLRQIQKLKSSISG